MKNRLRRSFTTIALVLLVALPWPVQAQSDTTKPRLMDLTILPATIDTTDGLRWILIVAHLTDTGAGVAHATLRFRPISGVQKGRQVNFHPENLMSGSIFDGYYVARLFVPQLAENGEWLLDRVYVDDRAGNYIYVEHNGLEPYMGYSFWNGPSAEGTVPTATEPATEPNAPLAQIFLPLIIIR